jgi:hypothetical protein
MIFDKAKTEAKRLNTEGRYRESWFYYVAYHDIRNEFFVMRRPKNTPVHVAIFVDGRISLTERQT